MVLAFDVLWVLGGVVVYGVPCRLLAVTLSRTGVRLVAPNYLLLHFLCEAHTAGPGPRRAVCVEYYRHTLAILAAADGALARLAPPPGAPAALTGKFRHFVDESPFGLTVRTLGDVNENAAYLTKITKAAAECGDAAPVGVACSGLAAGVGTLPGSYFPARGRPPPPPFDYGGCEAFRMDGRRIPEKAA